MADAQNKLPAVSDQWLPEERLVLIAYLTNQATAPHTSRELFIDFMITINDIATRSARFLELYRADMFRGYTL
jgi:hypothetical protein